MVVDFNEMSVAEIEALIEQAKTALKEKKAEVLAMSKTVGKESVFGAKAGDIVQFWAGSGKNAVKTEAVFKHMTETGMTVIIEGKSRFVQGQKIIGIKA